MLILAQSNVSDLSDINKASKITQPREMRSHLLHFLPCSAGFCLKIKDNAEIKLAVDL